MEESLKFAEIKRHKANFCRLMYLYLLVIRGVQLLMVVHWQLVLVSIMVIVVLVLWDHATAPTREWSIGPMRQRLFLASDARLIAERGQAGLVWVVAAGHLLLVLPCWVRARQHLAIGSRLGLACDTLLVSGCERLGNLS